VELTHPSLASVEAGNIPSALVFGAGSGVVAATWVAGSVVWRNDA
jgi:cytosine/adenosine deaminase-related metal-dependent hydrolase